ncbi:MAG: hypothetical protein V3R93_01610 [Candidatus Hydrothermarchaeaceae archaeon]
MIPIHHFLFSTGVFGILYLDGFSLSFVLLGFFSSILVDVDHMILGKHFGTYNPVEVYHKCLNREIGKTFSPGGFLLRRWFDFRELPFHNLFLNAALLVLVFPVGIGVLLHNALDAAEYVASNVMGWNLGYEKL